MYHWTARGLLVLGMISLLLPGKFSQAQRNSSGKAITLQPGQTITIQLSGSEFNDLTDVRVVTIGRRPAPANVVRASLGRQTRAGRPATAIEC